MTDVDLEGMKQDLGARLRALRRQQSMSGEELAALSQMSQPKVSRIETGRTVPQPADVERIIDGLGVGAEERVSILDQATRLADISRSLRRSSAGGGMAQMQSELGHAESLYAEFRDLALVVVPGLLQTPHYMRSVMALSAPGIESGDLNEAVLKRLERQQILEDESRSFHFLIHESVLSTVVSTVDHHLVQLAHLQAMAARSHVDVRLLVDADRTGLPMLHGFTVFDRTRVAIELLHAEIFVGDEEDVGLYLERHDSLTGQALTTEASIDRIALATKSLKASSQTD